MSDRNMAVQIELEAFITEREGMIAENRHREQCGNSIAYGADEFQALADKIKELHKYVK